MIVWMSSYPRSGNTFFRVLIKQCLGFDTYSVYGEEKDVAPDEMGKNLVGATLLPTNMDYDDLRKSENIYFIKTHGRFEQHMAQDRIVYLVRDGREATESYFHYVAKFGRIAYTRFELISGTAFVSSWGNHVENWLVRKQANILLIRFEDLIKEPTSLMGKISDFVGLPITNDSIPTFETLQAANPKFFRAGRNNSWEKTWSQDEEAFFWYKNAAAMKRLGYGESANSTIPMHNESLSKEFEALRLALLSELQQRFDTLDQRLEQISRH